MATVTRATGSSLGLLAQLAAERIGDESLLLFEDERWTGSELADRANRLAGGLRAAGLHAEDRVVVCMANCPEVGITYNAVWRAGAAVTPVLFLLSEPELRHVLADSGARFVVTTPEFLAKVLGAATGLASVLAVVLAGELPAGREPAAGEPPVLDFAQLAAAAPAELVDPPPDAMAALLYTGGTTGRAKGVVLSHDALSAAAWAAHVSGEPDYPRDARPVGLSPLPLSHVYGLTISVMWMHAAEPGTSVLMRWFDPADFLALVARDGVHVSALVPSMIRMLLDAPVEDYDTTSLRKIISGSAPLPPATVRAWGRRLPNVVLCEGYGCTEAAAIATATPGAAVRAGSVGCAALGVELRIERPDGAAAATGETGEVCIRGASLMGGYWNDPAETARAIRDGWLHTGDIGRLDADGYLFIVDRIKDVIIRNGFNVYPRDVEDVLTGHPAVAAAAVVGRPDPALGEEVVAFVELEPGATVTPAELVAYAKERLSAVKYPREVHAVPALPLTSVQKTDRKALRALLDT